MANAADALELNLSPELMARLRQRASEEHRPVEELVQDAVEAMLNETEWVAQVEEGLREADAGDVVDFDEFKDQFLKKVRSMAQP